MSNSFFDIQKRIKDRLESEAAQLEGSFAADNVQAVANELARIYSQDIDTLLPKAYVSTAQGENLDSCCSDYGVSRNPATYAECYVTLEGEPGTYENAYVTTGTVLFRLPEQFQIPGSGKTEVKAVCTVPGEAGNVLSGSINRVTGIHQGKLKVINEAAAKGGFEEESDESLRNRTLERIRTPSTSGNIADYKKWALEITGVEKVKVFPLSRGNGTVDVVLVAEGGQEAPALLLQKTAEHIEESRPIGADVLVESAKKRTIEISANILALPGYTVEGIQAELFLKLDQYFRELSFEVTRISYLKIADLFFECEGVVDVLNYSLNGGQDSIQLDLREFPKAVLPVISFGGGRADA